MEDGTKQHIITPLSGLCNTPSDFVCDDNAILFANGVRYVEGELKAIQSRGYTNTAGYTNLKLVFVHEYAGTKRLVYYNTSDSYLYWTAGDNAPTNKIDICKSDFERIVSIGSTLVILHTGSTLSYATWNGDGYTVTSQDTSPKYMFRLGRVSGRGFSGIRYTDSDNYKSQNIDHESGCFRTDNQHRMLVVRDDAYETCVNVLKTLRNELLTDVYKRKHFVFPFFAVAAIRMFDGSYKYIGRPQLMLTFAKGPSTLYYYPCCYNEDYNGIDFIRASLIGEWELKFAQDINLSSMNANVNGINSIESIDVFITRPVQLDEFYDGKDEQSGDKAMWRKATYQATYNGVVDSKIIFDGTSTSSQVQSAWPAECDIKFAYDGGNNAELDLWESTYDPYHAKDDNTIRKELIDSLGQFRKIASIPYGDTNDGKISSINVADYMEESTLQTLDNQELLTFSDEYEDWCNSYPDDINAINRRLLQIGGKQSLYINPYLWESTYIYNPASGNTYDIEIQIQTTAGLKVVWQTCNDRNIYIDGGQMWFYYPDPRATQFTVWVHNQKQYVATAKFQHDSPIGGSYYFGRYPTQKLATGSITTINWRTTQNNNGDTVNFDNRIVQSPVDNAFNDESKQSVGQGDIIKVASLTTALTQDAYKVSTVIAFTTQGIWSITCGNDGSFTSVSPAFSREVCVNKNSVIMTDNKVYFASSKGLMCIVATSEEGVSVAVSKFTYEGIAPKEIAINGGSISVGDSGGGPLYDYYEEVAKNGWYVYDYYTQAILMFYPGRKDYFVHDINSATIYYCSVSPMADSATFVSAVEDYPDAYLISGGNSKTYNCRLSSIKVRHRDSNRYRFEIVSRPLKLGGALFLKSLRRVRLLSSAITDCTLRIYGSNDLNSTWHTLPSLGGRPYKYYMYKISGTMSATSSIAGLMMETQIRYTDKPH